MGKHQVVAPVRPVPDNFEQSAVQIGPCQIVSGSGELFNHVDDGLPMWAGDGDREVELFVPFRRVFAGPPAVTLGINGIDSDHSANLRFVVTPDRVQANGFVIRFKTWGDTHIARACVSWQAVGASLML
jgi:hypothetical protein